MPTGCWLALHAASDSVAGRSTRSLGIMKRAPGPIPNAEYERAIIDLFMAPERRERLHMFRERRRDELVQALHTPKFLDPAVTIPVTVRTGQIANIVELMRKHGATDQCYAISAQENVDARLLPIEEALREVAGFSVETVLFCPGTRVGHYEGVGYIPT